MESLKPNKPIDLARARMSQAAAKIHAHEEIMELFKTNNPHDMENPDYWVLKDEGYKLRDAYYEAKKIVHDRIFYTLQ